MEIFLTVLFSVIGTIVIVCLLSVTIPDLKLMFSRKARAEEKTMKIRVAELEAKVETLEQQLVALQQKETHIVLCEKDTSGKQLLNVSNLKVNATSITHISSQTFEQSGTGDSRVKLYIMPTSRRPIRCTAVSMPYSNNLLAISCKSIRTKS
jgi:hypothetical protein